ncbi:MAG: response regulator, partial [Candidatus Eremiobacterota bacterium]
MSIFKKIKDLLKTDLLACIITDKPVDTEVPCTDERGKDVAKIYYSGAWKEEGVAKWAFFEEKDNTLYSTVKLNEHIAKENLEALCDSSGQNKTEEKKEVTAEKPEEIIIKEVSSEEKLIEEVVSITEMGRTRSRYQTEEEAVTDGLIDQREVTGNKNKIKVFFAEDNRSFQIIIRKLLEKSDDMELLDWATDGRDAVEKIKKLDTVPDVILMDIAMPRLDGISAIKEILAFNNSF